MRNKLLKAFWNCGDNDIIEFALLKARLNANEKKVITLALDECMSQEEIAEELDISTRKVQEIWLSAQMKLLNISWVGAYAKELLERN